MILTPGYHYSKIRGGLKRSKIHSRPSQIRNTQQSENDLNTMPYDYYVPSRMDGMRPFHFDPWPSYSTSDSTDLYDHPANHHRPSVSHRVYRYIPSESRYHHNHPSVNMRRNSLEPIRVSRRGGAGSQARSRSRRTRADEGDIIDNHEPDQYFEALDTPHGQKIPTGALEEMTIAPNDSHDDTPREFHPNHHQYLYSPTGNFHQDEGTSSSSLRGLQALDRPGTRLVAFQAAAAKLNETTKHAISFFNIFQSKFESEIHELTAYANRDTIRLAWKDRILRNEKYHSKPKEGWVKRGPDQTKQKGSIEDRNSNQEWSVQDQNASDNDVTDDVKIRNDPNHDPLITFGEHQHDLKHKIASLLSCQILQPKFRTGSQRRPHYEMHDYKYYFDDDDYVEPEDIQNVARYSSAHKLRQRIGECQKDLVPLLDRMRDDYRCMDAALTELNVLASYLETYSKAWRRTGSCQGRSKERVVDQDSG